MFVIDLSRFAALVFDLDGVVTKTASIHAAAWKRTFDEMLSHVAREPFDIVHEYRTYLDGKPRRDGIRSFLDARGIAVPEGVATDKPEANTVYGLAARKDRYFVEYLAVRGVGVHADATGLCSRARARGVKTAVVSASEHGAAVLAAAHATELFDARVDGLDAARLHLRGKPAPDTFLEAARQLGVAPGHCVVFEDALAGVRAGRAGNFGLVIGVDRVLAGGLRRGGADAVVTTLDEVALTLCAERELR